MCSKSTPTCRKNTLGMVPEATHASSSEGDSGETDRQEPCQMPNGNNEQVEAPEFEDDPGQQSYQPGDVPLDREVITTPYDAPVRTLLDEIKEKTLIVNPPFQRQSIWDKVRQSRLDRKSVV